MCVCVDDVVRLRVEPCVCVCVWMMWSDCGWSLLCVCVCVDDVRLRVEPCVCAWMMWSD